MIRFGHLELFVRDPLESLSFFRDALGATVTTIQHDTFVWLELGAVEILLRPSIEETPPPEKYASARSGIVLYCDDLTEKISRLAQAGVGLNRENGDCFSFTDPEGHWFQIVDPASH